MQAKIRKWAVVVVTTALVAAIGFSLTVSIRDAWKLNRHVRQLGSPIESDRDDSLRALEDLGVDVTIHLLPLLASSDSTVREFAACELYEIYYYADVPDAVVRDLIKMVLDERAHEDARKWAFDTLTRVAERSEVTETDSHEAVVAALRTAVQSETEWVVVYAASALRAFGPIAKSAEPDLLRIWEDSSSIDVGAALCSICPGKYEATVIPALLDAVDALDVPDLFERPAPLCYLEQLGPRAVGAIPRLERLAHSKPNWAYHIHGTLEVIQAKPDQPANNRMHRNGGSGPN